MKNGSGKDEIAWGDKQQCALNKLIEDLVASSL
jgi:hypothetical protein